MLPWVSSPCFLDLPILSRIQYSIFTSSAVGSVDSHNKALFLDIWLATMTRLVPYLKKEKDSLNTFVYMNLKLDIFEHFKRQKMKVDLKN